MTYDITVSRSDSSWDKTYEDRTGRTLWFTGWRGKTYTVEVVAKNKHGSSASAKASIDLPEKEGRPGKPANLKIRLVDGASDPDKKQKFKATWDKSSGGGVTYDITVSRSDSSWDKTYEDRTGRTLWFTGWRGVAYKVKVTPKNKYGTGPSVSQSIKLPAPPPPPPPVCNLNESRNKFRTIKTGLSLWDQAQGFRKVQALQSFTTLDKQRVRRGDVGGKVKLSSNLSQNGCSWIFGNAVVNDKDVRVFGHAIVDGTAVIGGKARIYENAHVRGNAKVRDAWVYGDADLYGNKAVVYGNARVYGNADVYDAAHVFGSAHVYGSAKVKGEAQVSGSATVRGKAVIEGKMRIDSGVYDGNQEYRRIAQALYDEVFETIVDELVDCVLVGNQAAAERDARLILNPSSSSDENYRQAKTILKLCKERKLFRDMLKAILNIATPGPLDFVLVVTGPLARIGQLPAYVHIILALIDQVDDFREVYKATYDGLEKAYEGITTK